MPILFVYPKKGEAFEFALSGQSICLGRSLSNDIVISDQFSSGCHAMIVPKGDGYVVQDQASKNGTFLNGSRISREIKLNKGDEIMIGSTLIVFDRDTKSRVIMMDDTMPPISSSTVIPVKDILKKPSPTGTGIVRDQEQLQQEQKIIAVLGEASQALIYHMDLDKLLDRVMDLITQNIPMDRGVIMLKEGKPEALVPRLVRVQSAPLKSQSITVSQSILRTVLEKNSSILIADIQSDKRLSEQKSVVAAQLRSAMCVPLWNNQEIIGAIYADRIAMLEQFSIEDLRLMTVLANLAALKIENVRLFEESQERARMEQELVMAQQIQSNFLPKQDPIFQPYDISGNARACHHVGGDYFDFIPISPSELGIVIADVCGHGVGAALLMASMRSSLHALMPAIKDPAFLAAKLSDMVHSPSDSHTYISFFLCVLDREKGEVKYVNAGHNPPLLLNPAGEIRWLESTGYCLGMFPSINFGTRTIGIEPGELLCLYTDGIVESRNSRKEEFGEERLAQQLRECAGLPAREILKKICEGVSTFTACEELSDDMTLIVIKRLRGDQSKGMNNSLSPEWKELKVEANLGEVERVRAFLREELNVRGVTEEEALKLELALHEIFVNVTLHAYPGGGGDMAIRTWSEAGTFYVEIRDKGVQFNPDEIPPVDLEKKIQLKTPGGLGIFIFKTLTDGYSYKRDGDENVLTFFKHLAAQVSSPDA
jgi:sigma-B regulation protein RsbU (phosphoserine phosphatase)